MAQNFSSYPSWNQTQERLKLAMQKEVTLMREMLANMHQEELALLMNDSSNWQKVMEDRSEMVVMMFHLRRERDKASIELKQSTNGRFKNKKLFEVLKIGDEISGEILSLLDQIIALIERTNLQNCRNDFLFHQDHSPSPLHCSYPPPFAKPMPSSRPIRKTQLATYPRKKP